MTEKGRVLINGHTGLSKPAPRIVRETVMAQLNKLKYADDQEGYEKVIANLEEIRVTFNKRSEGKW